MEEHQETTDNAIIKVAEKVGKGGGGNTLAQLLPLLSSRGPNPLEKVAMGMFIRNIAFSTLVTERLAKKQFGDEYTKMIKDMESEMSGGGTK